MIGILKSDFSYIGLMLKSCLNVKSVLIRRIEKARKWIRRREISDSQIFQVMTGAIIHVTLSEKHNN